MKREQKDENTIILANQIYDFVSDEGGSVTFAAISYKFGTGDIAVENGYIGLWGFFTQEVCAAMGYLFKKKKLLIMPSTREAYAKDGFETTMPIYPAEEQKPLKEIHWIPACLWTARQAKQGILELPGDYKKFYREVGCDV